MIQQEPDRRLDAAQAADPTRVPSRRNSWLVVTLDLTRTQAVERDIARVGKTIERLLTA